MRLILLLIFIAMIASGCASPAAGSSLKGGAAAATPVPVTQAQPQADPLPSPTPQATTTAEPPRLWISPAVPENLRAQLRLPTEVSLVDRPEKANLWFDARSPSTAAPNTLKEIAAADWVYLVVVPFPTTADDADIGGLRHVWENDFSNLGDVGFPVGKQPILMTEETRAALEALWGPADSKGFQAVDKAKLLDTAWKAMPSWAIIPFEDLQPRWKVLHVQNMSPLERSFNGAVYPLTIRFALYGTKTSAAAFTTPVILTSNYDSSKLTVLAMTGTTAISRHIGERMESKGMTYPATGIDTWLRSADLTHISNEVSFYKDCPKPGPERADMRFCSSPQYIELLDYVGTDIVELTGNHNLDWGTQPFMDSLAMYQQRGWKTYGGGATLQDATRPLLVEDHGNKMAFIGCSPAGPQSVWATADKPGSAPCDFGKIEEQIRDLKAQGYLPIVTFQAVETDTYLPAVAQGMPNFRRMAQAGAVIVSGSQSHVPQTMTFVGDSFVHYGLGNLFFDQMNPIETRQEFIDQHVFYDGKYLGVQLFTALLEDYARPRPMTTSERSDFLQKIFSLCDWSGN